MLISKNVFYLARRYLWSTHQHQSIQVMINVCAVGILIATCALALVLSIMTGFEQATYKKMQSIYPDLMIDSNGQSFDESSLEDFFKENHTGIAAYATQNITQALMTYEDNTDSPTMIIMRGIDPAQESHVSNIESKIIHPSGAKLEELLDQDSIIIGSKLAENLNLEIDDTAYILYTTNKQSSLHVKFKQYPVIIRGLFTTGIEDFDASLLYCNQKLSARLFPETGITHIHIKLQDKNQETAVCNHLKQKLNAPIYSWKDLYPTLLSALKLEKWAMFLILILIVCVASMNIISLIFMYVTQKQKDIIILLCMGMTRKKIRQIFLCISMLIAIPSATAGLTLAWIVGTLLQYFPCIKLPDNIYDTQYLPIQLELPIFCAILVITIIISLLASLYATRNIDRIKMVELLKTH